MESWSEGSSKLEEEDATFELVKNEDLEQCQNCAKGFQKYIPKISLTEIEHSRTHHLLHLLVLDSWNGVKIFWVTYISDSWGSHNHNKGLWRGTIVLTTKHPTTNIVSPNIIDKIKLLCSTY